MRCSGRLVVVLSLAAASVLTSLAPTSAAEPDRASAAAVLRYEVAAVIDAPGEGGPTGRALSENGIIAGWYGYPTQAYVWEETTGLTPLPALTGRTHSTAHDVNDQGVVVGQSGRETIDPPQRAVRWVDGLPQDLGVLPGHVSSTATGVNEAGVVVGSSSNGSRTHAVVWTEATGLRDITPTSSFAEATDVNEAGQVTGSDGSQAFVWDSGVLTRLGAPAGYARSFGYAINDAGQVAASVSTASGNAERVARWTPGLGWEVLGGSGDRNVGRGINNDGTVVGDAMFGSFQKGFVAIGGGPPRELTDLLAEYAWDVLWADDVDDAGRIVVDASSITTGLSAVLLLEPVAVPTMQDRGLRVRVAAGGAATGLRVVDETGAPVPDALVTGSWSRDGLFVATDSGRSDPLGRVGLRERLPGLTSGEVVGFCVVDITHPDFAYVPPVPSCASTTVP